MQEIEDGMYVRVNGHLKVFQGVRQIVAFYVRPVKNFDEVTFHFIECIHTHLQMSKLQLQGNAATQTRPMNSSLNTPVGSRSTGYQTAPSNQFSGQFSVHGLKSCDQLVLDYLQQPSSIFALVILVLVVLKLWDWYFIAMEKKRGYTEMNSPST
ncbi:hypothetical protein ACFX1X_044007 [Malus domestica]|uniref:replication protein A 32 kDa subunit B-like n=1 Tax=Malus domestica TaxID=3750 RepID=UPI00397576F7